MAVGLLEIPVASAPMAVFSPVGLMEESATNRLQSSFADITRQLLKELDDVGTQSANALSLEDFNERRVRLFPAYQRLTRAISNVVLAKLDYHDLPTMIDASFAALKAEIETKWAAYFTDITLREINFSVSTLESAFAWVPGLFTTPVDESAVAEDRELADKFALSATWAQFHLEVLKSAARKNLAINPDVTLELLAGLRFSVMAYSYVRQALDLRNALDDRYANDLNVSWDEEDEALANAE
jgi:hypothetical protein